MLRNGNSKMEYHELVTGSLYAYVSPSVKELLFIFTEPTIFCNVTQVIPQSIPFMVIEKLYEGEKISYKIMWTDENDETNIGWTNQVEVIGSDISFYEANINNTLEFINLDLKDVKKSLSKRKIVTELQLSLF